MSWAVTGGVAAAAMFCAVFWTPRARPAQDMPAISATAVKASPLVLTVRATATSSAPTASGERHHTPSAVRPSTAAITQASHRIGRSLLRARSDHRPAASRVAAPARLATAMTRPASTGDQPRPATRYSSAKAVATNWGTTSSVLEAWIRHSVGTR
jgi:hypothetical protein